MSAAWPLLNRTLGLREISRLYEKAQSLSGSFPRRALEVLNISTRVSGPMDTIPASGPLLVVANHPFGTLDGLSIAAALEPFRKDVRLLVNQALSAIPELRELCFFVDPFGGATGVARSRAGLRAAHLWLRRGGTLVMFPAGEVAHGRLSNGTHADSAWSETVGRLVTQSRATVVPVHVRGRNGASFYAAGRMHPRLRTFLLPREMLRRAGQEVALTFGAPIRPLSTTAIAAHDVAATAREVTAILRSAVDALGDSKPESNRFADEIAALPSSASLVAAGHFSVYVACSAQIPTLIREIGRVRELTYRAIGEGTGRALDLDGFDDHYQHLFLWDNRANTVVGAYRIGEVERLVAAQGVAGLYTQQLFQFDERFVRQLGPALELGRSWIRAEYQKNYNALSLLWKGIARFVVERSNARVLFGPVSISSRYSDSSHALLMAFLEQNFQDASLAPLVQPRHPKHRAPVPAEIVLPKTIDDAQALVMRLEQDGKGVPVLLRQYLKLNARLIGFNVDPDFGDALDALMMVDLTQVDRHILARYLGSDTARQFLAKHAPAAAA
jgi:putative hemolysin